jgi:hypothetical protein
MTESNQPIPEAMESSPPAAPVPPPPARERPWTRMWARLWLRPLIAIVGIAAALTLVTTLAVVVDLKSATGGGSGTPESTVLSWTEAMKSGDYTTADTYLSSNLEYRGTTSRSINSSMNGLFTPSSSKMSIDCSIVSSSTQGATASVVVRVKRVLTGTTMGTTRQLTIVLVQESGAWKVDSVRTTY